MTAIRRERQGLESSVLPFCRGPAEATHDLLSADLRKTKKESERGSTESCFAVALGEISWEKSRLRQQRSAARRPSKLPKSRAKRTRLDVPPTSRSSSSPPFAKAPKKNVTSERGRDESLSFRSSAESQSRAASARELLLLYRSRLWRPEPPHPRNPGPQ